MDSEEVAAIHSFCNRRFSGDGGDCILVGGDEGRHKACPYRGV